MTSRLADPTAPLRGAVDALAQESAGVVGAETVAEVLFDSLERLGRTRVATDRPVLPYRFAGQRLSDAAATSGLRTRTAPVVLFVCTQDAGRSQLAAALLEHAAGDLPRRACA